MDVDMYWEQRKWEDKGMIEIAYVCVVRLGEREESGMREKEGGTAAGDLARYFREWANAKRERGNALCTEIDGGMERTQIRERACVSTSYGGGKEGQRTSEG